MLVRRVVFRLDRQRQRFDGAQVQRRDLLGVVLLRFQSPEIQPVRPENDVDDGKSQEYRLPAYPVIEDADQRRYASADKVIGERPEITLVPDLSQIPVFRDRDHAGDRKGIHQEVTDRRDRHPNRQRLAAHAEHVIYAIRDRDGDRSSSRS